MKLGDSNLVTKSIMVAVVLSLAVSITSQTAAAKYNDHKFPTKVGKYVKQHTIFAFARQKVFRKSMD